MDSHYVIVKDSWVTAARVLSHIAIPSASLIDKVCSKCALTTFDRLPKSDRETPQRPVLNIGSLVCPWFVLHRQWEPMGVLCVCVRLWVIAQKSFPGFYCDFVIVWTKISTRQYLFCFLSCWKWDVGPYLMLFMVQMQLNLSREPRRLKLLD